MILGFDDFDLGGEVDGGGVEDTGLYFCHEVGHVIAGGVAGVDDEAGVLLRHLCAAHRQPLQAALVDEGGGIMPLRALERAAGAGVFQGL